MPLFVLAYLVLIVYGSVYPFSGWHAPESPLFSFIWAGFPTHIDQADIILNVLVYIPLGLLLRAGRLRRKAFGRSVLVVAVTGACWSLAMESFQQFNPLRVPSLIDVIMNAVGTLAGAALSVFFDHQTSWGKKILAIRDNWFLAGSLADTGLIIIGLWMVSQTSPLVPSLDVSHLRHGLALLADSLHSPLSLNLAKTAVISLYVTALGLLACTLRRPGKPIVLCFMAFIGVVFLSKVMIVGRQLSLEDLVGAAIGMLMLLPLSRTKTLVMAIIGTGITTVGFIVYEMMAANLEQYNSFNWVPFLGQMRSLSGLENILELLWPSMAIAYFTRYLTPNYWQNLTAIFGAMMVAGGVFVLEWHQPALQGRFGDITDVILSTAGWLLPWIYAARYTQITPMKNTVSREKLR